MKKYILPASAAALMIVASCAKEPAVTEQSAVVTPEGKVVITATFPDGVDSKVSMDETATGLDLKWEDDDFLTIVGNTTEKYEISTISPDGKTATFTGNPVEGGDFKVILSEKGEAYADREFTSGRLTQQGDNVRDHVAYDAVLEGVSDYTTVSFTKEWAEAKNATFSQTGCLMFHVQLPESCSQFQYLSVSVTDEVFSASNKTDCEKSYRRMMKTPTRITPDDGTIKAYFMTSMNQDVIPAGQIIRVVLEGSGACMKDIPVTEDIFILPGKRTVIKVNKSGWTDIKKVSCDDKNSWTAPYCNISYVKNGPGKVIDDKTDTFWELPWNTGSGKGAYDTAFTAWTTEGSNTAKVPMIGIFNLGEVKNVHSISITRRLSKTNTKKVEIYVSSDESNDADLGELLKRNLLDSLTDELLVAGKWDLWNAKKWIKIGAANNDFDKDVKNFETAGVPVKYVKLVGLSDDAAPVLAIAELDINEFVDK